MKYGVKQMIQCENRQLRPCNTVYFFLLAQTSLIVELYASPLASIACHLPFMSFLITFLSTSTNGNSVNSPPPPCAAFDCGNGLTLGYPFHPQNEQPTFCGYPNFAISCTNNQPILHIANNPYTVKNLNTSENSITVVHVGAADTATCPIATHAVKLDPNSLLNFTNTNNKIIHFYYNCTVYPPSVPNIKCLQRGAKHSYAFVDGSVPEFNWIQYCESIVTVPVIENAVDDLVGNGSGDALKQGFKLKWKAVDHACQLCEASGGFCGYSYNSVHQKLLCFCSDGQRSSLSCHGAGEFSITSQPNYVAIGAVVSGGLLAITIVVFFFINKKKIGVEKHRFSQIPTTYGK